METSIIKKNPGSEVIEEVIHKNGGYCLCKAEHNASTKCPCQEFQDQFMGDCTCGLYTKTPADYIIFTREGCPRCDILKKELTKRHKVYVESTEYPEGMLSLPQLMAPSGTMYTFREALTLLSKENDDEAQADN